MGNSLTSRHKQNFSKIKVENSLTFDLSMLNLFKFARHTWFVRQMMENVRGVGSSWERKQNSGFEDHEHKDYVFKFSKALYGLK